MNKVRNYTQNKDVTNKIILLEFQGDLVGSVGGFMASLHLLCTSKNLAENPPSTGHYHQH